MNDTPMFTGLPLDEKRQGLSLAWDELKSTPKIHPLPPLSLPKPPGSLHWGCWRMRYMQAHCLLAVLYRNKQQPYTNLCELPLLGYSSNIYLRK